MNNSFCNITLLMVHEKLNSAFISCVRLTVFYLAKSRAINFSIIPGYYNFVVTSKHTNLEGD